MSQRQGIIIGRPLIRFERIDSTNKYAIELISKSNPSEGTAIYALDQYDGRGQIGRKWQSEPGQNISVSIILHPQFLQAVDQFRLNMAVSLAVKATIDSYIDTDSKIKWPNDIYVKDKKIAGILIQNTLHGKNIRSSIVGVGININQVDFDKKLPNPTSLSLETEKSFNILEIMDVLFYELQSYYNLLKKGGTDELYSQYHKCLYKIDLETKFLDEKGREFIGTILRINASGALVVDVEGEKQVFNFRELKFVI